MTTPNYHPTPPKVAPRLEKPTKEKGTSEKPAKQKVVDVVIEIMRHDHPEDTRDVQLVYIERVVGVAMLERDGKEKDLEGKNTKLDTTGFRDPYDPDFDDEPYKTWYYEKFTLHQLDYSISYESRLRLLIQNWSEEKEKNVDNIIQNNYLGVGEYVEDLMRPFIPTQDGTLAKLKTGAQIKVLVRRVLIDLQEVVSLVREADAEQVVTMYTLEKKMDECLRSSCTNGKITEDLIKELNIMRHDEPIDTRDDQLVYIERVAVVAKLETDGRIEKCYEDSLAGIPGTTQGTSYPKHDMVRGMKAYLSAAMRINGIESNAWEEINVTQWPLRNIIVPKGDESALYMLKNIQLFTGEKPRMQYDQAYIDKFRRELPIVLDGSPYNKMK
ncbi:hypothetical protein ZWY2020_025428 [Hordeum vulgare]|nr:hypothetical protein ZWY2020_025428 [Hordeum vulgare]